MRKLPEGQEAKELRNEAIDWSTFKWTWEKSRVRQIADWAHAPLDHQERVLRRTSGLNDLHSTFL